MAETTIKMWAPWHPEHGFGEVWAASAFGNIDEAIRLNNARRIMGDDDRWKVVPVTITREPTNA